MNPNQAPQKKITGPRYLTTKSGNWLCFIPNFPTAGKNCFIYIHSRTKLWLANDSECNFGLPINDVEWRAILGLAGKTLRPMSASQIEIAKKEHAKRMETFADPVKFEAFKLKRDEDLQALNRKKHGVTNNSTVKILPKAVPATYSLGDAKKTGS